MSSINFTLTINKHQNAKTVEFVKTKTMTLVKARSA